MNTVYPGARSDTGEKRVFSVCSNMVRLCFFPLTGQNLNTNTCEASAFFDLFPIGIVLSLYVILIEKKRDRMLIPLLTAQAILVIYCTFGLPGFLAKVTLLSYSPANRVLLAVGLINVLLLIRSISIAERKPRFWAAAAVSLALAVGVGLLCPQPGTISTKRWAQRCWGYCLRVFSYHLSPGALGQRSCLPCFVRWWCWSAGGW